MDEDEDAIEFFLFTTLLSLAQTEMMNIMLLQKELINVLRKNEENHIFYNKIKTQMNNEKKFSSWNEMVEGTSDQIFRLKFRMTKQQFKDISKWIELCVGTKNFIPERICKN